MAKAYKSIEVEFLQKELAFKTEEECRQFLLNHGGILTTRDSILDTKKSSFRKFASKTD